ncbi:L,D-transpeptidase catalytic domain [Prosthecobacter debontii]|uniref:L,D-transpeptidase catalytic domain n=1 Tax=Prosthecobacter debontii TaxID=48467 RepID=A0A1T4XUQ2_9BACT|nr:L,D-transpeptidase [Prosthecobacter debontii]SKA92771.1 L,D-transpeptidase catalytic domain [Prosthecobacter debontii]
MHSIASLPNSRFAQPAIVRLGLALVGGAMLCQCTSTPKSEVVVSVKDQRMGLYHEGVLQKQYVISTSKFGLGDKPNSYCTPTGKHEIIAKIGHGLPTGAVLKSRHWNGEVLKPNAPGRDPIVSRILWLRGLESNNRNAMRRFIYIHGTTEEFRLGQPASYGCIRMGMKDVVDVFNDVNIGAKVVITKDHLPGGKKAHTAEPEVAPAPAPVSPAAAPAIVPVETPVLAAKQGKATSPSQAAQPSPVMPATPAAPKAKKSFFSFISWGKSEPEQPVAASAATPVPPAAAQPQSSIKVVTATPKPSKRDAVGPEVPEAMRPQLTEEQPVEKVSTYNRFSRLLGFNTHS